MSIVNNLTFSCYENIIGVSRSECACYPSNPYNTSNSDLYVDELEGMENIKQALTDLSDCDSTDIWEVAMKSVDQAIRLFIGNTNAELIQKYKLRKLPFNGAIGQKTYKQTRAVTKQYAGLRIVCADVVSGSLVLKNIGTIFANTGVLTLYVYDNTNTALYTINNIATTASKWKDNTLPTEISLPLHNDYVDNVEYFIFYEVNTSNYPKDNTINCGCGGSQKYLFNTAQPYFKSNTPARDGWANYIMVGSFEADIADLSTFDFSDLTITTSNYMNGLTLGMEISCNINETLCKDSIDFGNDPLAMYIAEAIRFKAGFLLLNQIRSSNILSRETLINGEQMNEYLNYYNSMYTKHVSHITSNADIYKNDCFVCKDKYNMVTSSIFK